MASSGACLAGRLAIVTGAHQGIGSSIAERLASEGAAVVGADRSASDAPGGLPPRDGTVAPWQLDVASSSSWDRLWGALAGASASILVNNAGGVGDRVMLHESTLEAWDATLALNLTSAFLGMRAALPAMLEAGTGTIINICSISGLRAHADAPAYQAAKSGIEALTRSAALAYGPRGVRVNAVTPSIIDTPAVARESPEHIASFVGRVPVGRMGQPGEVASAVAFLASDDASFVTGANLLVDGGFLA